MDSLPIQHSGARMPAELTSDEIDQVGGGLMPTVADVGGNFFDRIFVIQCGTGGGVDPNCHYQGYGNS